MTPQEIQAAWSRRRIHFTESACINTAWVVTQLLRESGAKPKLVPVDFAMFNPEAWALFNRQITREEWPDSAWSVGSIWDDEPRTDGTIPGHVVVTHDGIVFDLDAGRYNRPLLRVRDGIMLDMGDLKPGEWVWHVDPDADGTNLAAIMYRALPERRGEVLAAPGFGPTDHNQEMLADLRNLLKGNR